MKKAKWLDDFVFWLATRFGWRFVLLWGRLTRKEFVGREHLEWLRKRRVPYIFCIWHGRVLMPIYVHRNESVLAMVSDHRDGEMIAQTLIKLGLGAVRGSSTRGGRKAAIGMIRALRAGSIGAMIPDGPNGPRHVLKPGVVNVAQRAGAYILPMTFASSRFVQFKSWDRFYLWLPFSRTVVVYGEPVFIPPEADEDAVENFRRKIEGAMKEQEKFADAYFRK